MGLITTSIPAVGQPNSTEDPKVASDITTITTVVNGNLDLANLSPALQAIVPGTWTTYTPIWTCPIAPPVLGNGTLAGYYQTFNKTCIFHIKLTFGSTTSGGEGQMSFSLPTAAFVDTHNVIGSSFLDATATIGSAFQGVGIASTNTTVQVYTPFSGSNCSLGVLTNADGTGGINTGIPFSPGTYPMLNGCTLVITGVYRTQ